LRRIIDSILERRLPEATEWQVTADQRREHLLRHGDFALAYECAMEPGLSSFGDRRGFIAYERKMGHTFALGDPVADPATVDSLIHDFAGHLRGPTFVAIGQATAERLAARGFHVTHFGHDTVIDLAGHTFAGGAGKPIRYASSWIATNGMTVAEARFEDFTQDSIRHLSRSWRQSRVNFRREVGFLNRRLQARSEEGVRTFFATDAAGVPVGFVVFDPVYRDGRILGYLASGKRRDPERSAYLDMGVMRHAIDVFKAEGREAVWLGLSPIADLHRGPFRDSALLHKVMAGGYRSAYVNNRIFNFAGIAAYKRRFRGREIPLYIASPPGSDFTRLVALLRVVRLI
jgi:lysylphosphatidylglycerol synthetase-like protein (DUF2156 family)